MNNNLDTHLSKQLSLISLRQIGEIAADQHVTVVQDGIEESSGGQKSLKVDEKFNEPFAVVHQVHIQFPLLWHQLQQRNEFDDQILQEVPLPFQLLLQFRFLALLQLLPELFPLRIRFQLLITAF